PRGRDVPFPQGSMVLHQRHRRRSGISRQIEMSGATMNGKDQTCVTVRVGPDGAISRRGFLRAGAASLAGLGLFGRLALHADQARAARKQCILLWMAGGPSQFETFDPKPGAETQGPTKATPTAVSGINIAEHWRKVAGVTNELTVLRSMTSKEGN